MVAAVQERVAGHGALTAMMPTENAAWVAGELRRRFGPAQWWCYHGSVDESFALPGPATSSRSARSPGYAQAAATAAANASTSSAVVSHEHISRTSPVASSQV